MQNSIRVSSEIVIALIFYSLRCSVIKVYNQPCIDNLCYNSIDSSEYLLDIIMRYCI